MLARSYEVLARFSEAREVYLKLLAQLPKNGEAYREILERSQALARIAN
jgi:cytochrome c-type biogenesis protein CcmH/NrfG